MTNSYFIPASRAKQALVDLPPELDALTVQKAIEAIGRVKAEETTLVVHGQWIPNKFGYSCSICGCTSKLPLPYDAYCGAKMDVENSVYNVEKG